MADIVHFLGRVLPSSAAINVTAHPKIDHVETELGLAVTFRILVKNSAIDVECEVAHYEESIRELLFVRAIDRVSVPVDLIGFAMGAPLQVIFDTFVDTAGVKHPIHAFDTRLASLCASFRLSDASFDQVCRLVHSDHRFFMALRDLIAAISLPHISVTNCGRVIDGIRRMIAGDDMEAKKAWPIMQLALNISPDYQKWISDQAANPRHADRSYVSGLKTNEVIQRTWRIMDRFIEYRKRGNQPLTDPEFPLLV